MARLNEISYSDDEFPELSTILHSINHSPSKPIGRRNGKEHGGQSTASAKDSSSSPLTNHSPHDGTSKHPKSPIKALCEEKLSRKQRPLRLAHVNSLLLSTKKEAEHGDYGPDQNSNSRKDGTQLSTPRRTGRRLLNRNQVNSAHRTVASDDDQSFDDLSDFIVDDSASDEEDYRYRVRLQAPKLVAQKPGGQIELSRRRLGPNISQFAVDLTSPEKTNSTLISTNSPSERNISNQSGHSELFFEDEPQTCLRFCPTISAPPHKFSDEGRPATPPSSPSKSVLQSPSKKHRIPPSPHRPSIDAFWSQEVINDWNDQYSPRKTPKPGHSRGIVSINDDESESSPCGSPRKSPSKSPVKIDKEAVQRRKSFDGKKNGLAISFLKDLDEKIANGQIGTLAAAAGGIRITWSKKLISTAGRANWKRESIQSKSTDGTILTTYRHHASIELAEKVVDDENRLFNVVAHEYCHLANFMITGVKDNPHGKEFKEWAHKVTAAFAHLDVEVTTKHTYAITYKYVWTCTTPTCGLQYKRHSRSIDPAKHSCGKCRGKLVQVKPIPRPGAKAAAERQNGGVEHSAKKGRYQEYVKTHFGPVRSENPALGMAELMVLLGKMFREEKGREQDVAAIGKMAGRDVVRMVVDEDGDGGMDSVARKLDFLSLG